MMLQCIINFCCIELFKEIKELCAAKINFVFLPRFDEYYYFGACMRTWVNRQILLLMLLVLKLCSVLVLMNFRFTYALTYESLCLFAWGRRNSWVQCILGWTLVSSCYMFFVCLQFGDNNEDLQWSWCSGETTHSAACRGSSGVGDDSRVASLQLLESLYCIWLLRKRDAREGFWLIQDSRCFMSVVNCFVLSCFTKLEIW